MAHFADSQIELMIFDLDGTLAHTLPQLAKAARAVAREMGYFVPEISEVENYVGNGAALLLARTLCHDVNATLKSLPDNVQKEAREKFNRLYLEGLDKDFEIYPYVKEGLLKFKELGLKLAVVTNKPHIFTEPLLKYMGIYDLFDYVLGSEILDKKKPDPTPLLFVCNKLNVSVDKALMVGDSENDVKAGQNCNMLTIAFTYGYNCHKDIRLSNPDFVFDNFKAFVDKVTD